MSDKQATSRPALDRDAISKMRLENLKSLKANMVRTRLASGYDDPDLSTIDQRILDARKESDEEEKKKKRPLFPASRPASRPASTTRPSGGGFVFSE